MTTKTKPKIKDQLTKALAQAEATEETMREEWSKSAGLAILAEASDSEVAEASSRYQAAQRESAAIRSAISLLGAREMAAEAQAESARVSALRKESEAAHVAQMTALTSVAEAANALTKHLEVARAQSSVLNALHASLVESDPTGWAEVEQDRRDAEASVGSRYAQKRSEVREAAQRARYGLQHSDGVDHVIEEDGGLVLMGDQVAPNGTLHTVALPLLLDWELSRLVVLDKAEGDAMEQAFDDHAARTVVAGFGHLSASVAEVRDAGALNTATVGLLLPRETRAALAGLRSFLPTSSHQGIAVRSVPRSAIDAKAEEATLDAGLEAITRLTAN